MQKTIKKSTKKAKRSQPRALSEKFVLDTSAPNKMQSAMDRDQYVNELIIQWRLAQGKQGKSMPSKYYYQLA